MCGFINHVEISTMPIERAKFVLRQCDVIYFRWILSLSSSPFLITSHPILQASSVEMNLKFNLTIGHSNVDHAISSALDTCRMVMPVKPLYSAVLSALTTLGTNC